MVRMGRKVDEKNRDRSSEALFKEMSFQGLFEQSMRVRMACWRVRVSLELRALIEAGQMVVLGQLCVGGYQSVWSSEPSLKHVTQLGWVGCVLEGTSLFATPSPKYKSVCNSKP